MLSANEVFRRAYGGRPNFMTPDLIERRVITDKSGKTLAVELAAGTGMSRQLIYGVTVVDAETCKPRHDLSRGGFPSMAEADRYIEGLSHD